MLFRSSMSLKIVRWFFAGIAGISAFLVTDLGLMALSFGGPFRGFKDFGSAALPALCLPVFVLFLVRPKRGFYAFLLYLMAAWMIQIVVSAPRVFFNPLSSGMDKMTLLCVCAAGVSYWAYARIKLTTSSGLQAPSRQ